jgi:WD40 repeat protein
VTSLAFAADGKTIVSGSAGGSLRVHTADTGILLERIAPGGEIRSAAASPDGRVWIAGPDGGVVAWKYRPPAAIRALQGHWDMIHGVAVSADGKMCASASAETSVRLWSIGEWKELRGYEGSKTAAYCVAFSPDGELLAAAGFDGKVKLWKTADWSQPAVLEGHEEGVWCLAFAAGGRSILSGSSDGTIRKWSVPEGKEELVFRGHAGWVSGLEPVPGGSAVLSVDYDGNAILWDSVDGRKIAGRKLPAMVHSIAVSSDGALAAAGAQDGTVLVFPVPGR